MNRQELTDAAINAIALCVLAKDGFPIGQSCQRQASAGNLIHPLIGERIELSEVDIKSHSWMPTGLAIKRFVRRFTAVNGSKIDLVLWKNPIIALRVAEILGLDYSPTISGSPPRSDPSRSISIAASQIESGLMSRSLDILRLILNPSEENSEEIAVFYALLVALLHKDDDLSIFRADLTSRYKILADLVPTQQPSGALPNSGEVEVVIQYWLPNALFYHAISQRPVDLVIESLIKAELLLPSAPPLLPATVEEELHKVLGLVRTATKNVSDTQSSDVDPSEEDVGDMDTVSSIMDRIYNWMGPPPIPVSSDSEPILSSPGGMR